MANIYPASGVVNVKDFGAIGDGIADDTAAILAAIDPANTLKGPYSSPGVINPLKHPVFHNKPVYFPAGTYLVSNTLVKRMKDKVAGYLGLPNGRHFSGLIMLGADKATTIIKLKDNCPGFSDPANPKAVVFTASSLLLGLDTVVDSSGNLLSGKTAQDVIGVSTWGGKNYIDKGEGNDAYINFIEDLTIDVGAGNPGAVGLDYIASNVGAVRNVIIKDASNSATIGFSSKRFGPGPFLLKNITIAGFDVGMDIANPEYAVTGEHITINGSRTAGLRNTENSVSIRDLNITPATGPAIINAAIGGLIVVIDGLLQGTPGASVQNSGHLNLRNVHITGFTSFLGGPVPTLVDGVYSGSTFLQQSSANWSLPIEESPSVPLGLLADGADVVAFGADPTGTSDSTAAIEAAFASGKATVYFPHGQYLVTHNIVVPSTVHRIEGMFSTVRKQAAWNIVDWRYPIFQVQNTASPFEASHLNFDNTDLGFNIAFGPYGVMPFLVRDTFNLGIQALMIGRNADDTPQSAAAGGKVFIENVCTSGMTIVGPIKFWGRQFNTEGGGLWANSNVDICVLGLKTEANITAVDNSNGKTEILGGTIYSVNAANPNTPAFRNTDGKMLLSYVEEGFSPNSSYTIQVQDIKAGVTTNHSNPEFPPRALAGRTFLPRMVAKFSTTLDGNPVRNADFEQGSLNWNQWWNVAVNPNSCGGIDSNWAAHSGIYRAVHWSNGQAYEQATYQTINGIPNGNYKLTAWTQSMGGPRAFIYVAEYGGPPVFFNGPPVFANVPDGPSTWVAVETPVFAVTNGQVQVGLYSKAPGGWTQWTIVDDFALIPIIS